jgi:hypothetical protein
MIMHNNPLLKLHNAFVYLRSLSPLNPWYDEAGVAKAPVCV